MTSFYSNLSVNSAADVSHLQQDVNLILSRIDTHGITPNHSKTQLLPITHTKRPLPINIFMDSHPILSCKSVKYLGVTNSSNLTWSEHIKSTCKKAKKQLGFIHHYLSQSPPNVRHQIYRATVLPKLEYCCAVWDPHYVSDIDALENLQKFAGCVITRQWHSDYHILCSTLNWQPLSVRRKLQKVKVCYNIVNDRSIIPSSTFSLHPHPSPCHPHSQILYKPFVKTTSHMNSFFIAVIPIWNTLPSVVVESSNPSIFKQRVTEYFLTNY